VYRHYRKDFGPLQTRPLHLDLSFDLSEARVVVEARTTFLHVGAEALATLTLNSKDLDIQAVELLSGGAGVTTLAEKPSSEEFVAHVASLAGATVTPLKFEVDSKDHLLRVHLPSAVTKGTQFVLRTKSVATPTAHILEGLYFDWTPYVILPFTKCNICRRAACCASERDLQSSLFLSLCTYLLRRCLLSGRDSRRRSSRQFF
jgi:aminopeptidase N